MTKAHFDIDDLRPDQLVAETPLAVRWSISKRTLQRYRAEGFGPPYIEIGGSIRYRVQDILDYEERHRRGGGRRHAD